MQQKLSLILLSILFFGQVQAADIQIKIGTEGAFFPWNYCIASDGSINKSCTSDDVANGQTPAGFDVDLGNEMCAKMSELDAADNYICSWVIKAWSDLSTGQTLGTDYDIIIAQMVETNERKNFANFVGPYTYRPTITYISLIGASFELGGATKVSPRTSGNGDTIQDCPLNEAIKIGVQEETSHFTHVDQYCNNPISTFPVATEMDAALLAGMVDLIIRPHATAKDLIGGMTPQAKPVGATLEFPAKSNAASIAFAKTPLADGLQANIREALFIMFSSGYIRNLQDQAEKQE